jgi:ATP-binding cassette subfamily C protein LapB
VRGPGARPLLRGAARRADQRDGFSTEAQITAHHGVAQLKTVVLVTHRTSLLSLVSRVIVIDGGKVVADGPRDRIMEALQTGRIAKAA